MKKAMHRGDYYYCRNEHCRSKLAAPVENLHRAFCCRGCFERFHRKHCLVCENVKRHPERQLCGNISCKREKAHFPHLFKFSGTTLAGTVKAVAEVPILSTVKWLSGGMRGFGWAESDIDTWRLYDHEGRIRATVRRAEGGDRWWVARATPESPIETLAAAQHRGFLFALWSTPRHV